MLKPVVFFALLILLLPLLLACEGETITISQSTPDPEGTQRAASVPAGSSETRASPTIPPRPRVPFPPGSDGAALTALFDATQAKAGTTARGGWPRGPGPVARHHRRRRRPCDRVGPGRQRLSGELPEELGNLTGLTELDLRDNRLTGALPGELAALASLEELHLSNNKFTGALPAGLSALSGLTDLYLHDNQFSGVLPPELADLPNLEKLTFGGNKFIWADSYAPGLLADMVPCRRSTSPPEERIGPITPTG